VKYLTAEQILFIHSRIIDETGGTHGIRDIGLLQSAVERPKAFFKGKHLYPDIFHKTAAFMESLVKNHPFLDGNKRTSLISAGVFLQMNGFVLEVSQKDIVRFTLRVSQGKTTLPDIAEWFKVHSQKIS
jgi:death-on-curing protein